MTGTLGELARAVAEARPRLADQWEATALVESFGYTDRVMEQEFGIPHTLEAGRRIFELSKSQQPCEDAVLAVSGTGPWARLLTRFSSSIIYSVPWFFVVVSETLHPDAAGIPPEYAGPLSLALMASLISSGGMIHVIARRGLFYLCLNEPGLARRMCRRFIEIGIVMTIVICLVSLFFGFYFQVAAPFPLLLAGLSYTLLSVLWMFCAVLSIQKHPWRILMLFLGGVGLYAVARFAMGWSPLGAQLISALATVAGAGLLAVFGFGREKESDMEPMDLPRLPVLLNSLAPYFFYGAAYFSFLFADRLAAGSAISFSSGLTFGIDAAYKRGMDLALMNFLIAVAVVEYLNDLFMHHWRTQAVRRTPAESPVLRRHLLRRYLGSLLCMGTFFALTGAGLWRMFHHLQPALFTLDTRATALVGGLGYFLLSIGLFHAVILFSLNRPAVVLYALAPALALNFATGYCLSHLLGVNYAAAGLLLGGALFAARSCIAVCRAFTDPAYAFFAS